MDKHDLIWYLVAVIFLALQYFASGKKKQKASNRQIPIPRNKQSGEEFTTVEKERRSTGTPIFGDIQTDWREIFGGTADFPAKVEPAQVFEEQELTQKKSSSIKTQQGTGYKKRGSASHFSHNDMAHFSHNSVSHSSHNLKNKEKLESSSRSTRFSINGLDDMKRAVIYSELLNRKYKL